MLFLIEKINNKSKERNSALTLIFKQYHLLPDSIMTLCTPYYLSPSSPVSFQIYFPAIRWRYFRISKHFLISSSDKQLYTLTCANRQDTHIFGMSRSRCLMPKFCRNLKYKFLTGRSKFHFR